MTHILIKRGNLDQRQPGTEGRWCEVAQGEKVAMGRWRIGVSQAKEHQRLAAKRQKLIRGKEGF